SSTTSTRVAIRLDYTRPCRAVRLTVLHPAGRLRSDSASAGRPARTLPGPVKETPMPAPTPPPAAVDPKTADQALQTSIRPQTFPVAVRMLRPGEPIPERARRPARDFGKLSMNCQVIDMARRYGWMIALTREDHICSLGITALGFDRPTHLYNSGTLCE